MIRLLLVVAFLFATRCGMHPAFAQSAVMTGTISKAPILLPTPEPLPVWRGKDGSKWVWVKGEPHRISLPPPKVEWRDYAAYGASVLADYATTRSALQSGATEIIYRCSPARPGCMNTKLFATVSLAPLAQWAFYDLWGRHHVSRRWQRFQAGSRKTNIFFRMGVSIWNISQQ